MWSRMHARRCTARGQHGCRACRPCWRIHASCPCAPHLKSNHDYTIMCKVPQARARCAALKKQGGESRSTAATTHAAMLLQRARPELSRSFGRCSSRSVRPARQHCAQASPERPRAHARTHQRREREGIAVTIKHVKSRQQDGQAAITCWQGRLQVLTGRRDKSHAPHARACRHGVVLAELHIKHMHPTPLFGSACQRVKAIQVEGYI